MDDNPLIQMGLALLLGLLVGLQRERTDASIAGIRTFPLITMLGALCAMLALRDGEWMIAAGLVTVGALFIIGDVVRSRNEPVDPGLTTEFAGLVMFGVGACLVIGSARLALAVGGVVAILLHLKKPMHHFVGAMGERDVRAIMQFALITLVILPLLPDREFGPYAVLNPFKIWLMVVLIVSISLCGYVAYKFLDGTVGAAAGGLLGGLISSTATTVSFLRRTRESPTSAGLASLAVMIASAIVFVRVLIEMAVVARNSFSALAPPIFAMLFACALIAAAAYFLYRHEKTDLPEQGNPTELKSALIFGAAYAVVILLSAAAKEHFGSRGLYVVAGVSGLTDMDAITLSVSNLVENGKLEADTGWRAILLASMSNLVFKGGIVLFLGHPKLFGRISMMFLIALAAGGAILWFWP